MITTIYDILISSLYTMGMALRSVLLFFGFINDGCSVRYVITRRIISCIVTLYFRHWIFFSVEIRRKDGLELLDFCICSFEYVFTKQGQMKVNFVQLGFLEILCFYLAGYASLNFYFIFHLQLFWFQLQF